MWKEEKDGWIRTEKKRELILGWRVEKGRRTEGKNPGLDAWREIVGLENNPEVRQDRGIGVKNIDNQTGFD